MAGNTWCTGWIIGVIKPKVFITVIKRASGDLVDSVGAVGRNSDGDIGGGLSRENYSCLMIGIWPEKRGWGVWASRLGSGRIECNILHPLGQPVRGSYRPPISYACFWLLIDSQQSGSKPAQKPLAGGETPPFSPFYETLLLPSRRVGEFRALNITWGKIIPVTVIIL